MKFLKPAVLGDKIDFVVTSGRKPDSYSVTAYRNRRDQEGDEGAGEEIFKATGVVCMEQLEGGMATRATDLPCHISEFDIYEDELHHDLLSTKTVFNLMERARTNILGGPDRLLALSAKGCNIVVARVSDYSLCLKPSTMNVRVSSTTSMMMDSVLNFDQEISALDGKLLAQATISCLCVDPASGQTIPFPSLPQLEVLGKKEEDIALHSMGVKSASGKVMISRLPQLQDVASLKSIYNVDTVISLTEASEMETALGSTIEENGMKWIHFPIRDYSVPDDGNNATWERDLQPQIMSMAKEGKNVLFHCKGGCGRSGMLAYRILMRMGEDADGALKRLREVRPCAIETDKQLEWALRDASY